MVSGKTVHHLQALYQLQASQGREKRCSSVTKPLEGCTAEAPLPGSVCSCAANPGWRPHVPRQALLPAHSHLHCPPSGCLERKAGKEAAGTATSGSVEAAICMEGCAPSTAVRVQPGVTSLFLLGLSALARLGRSAPLI